MTKYTKCNSGHTAQRLRWICYECGKEFPLSKYEELKLNDT